MKVLHRTQRNQWAIYCLRAVIRRAWAQEAVAYRVEDEMEYTCNQDPSIIRI